jgi:hypothetical protein
MTTPRWPHQRVRPERRGLMELAAGVLNDLLGISIE